MDQFLSLIRFLQLNEFYLLLPLEEKQLMRRFGWYLSQEELLWPNFSRASLLWVIAANAVPAGKNEFAKKLLYHALSIAHSARDICYIHSNLAQIHLDEENPEDCNIHCLRALATGYYNKWAVDTLAGNLIASGRLTEAMEFCRSILANDLYRKDQPKYEALLAQIEKGMVNYPSESPVSPAN